MALLIVGVILIGVAVALWFNRKRQLNKSLNIKYYDTSKVVDVMDIYKQLREGLGGNYRGNVVELSGSARSDSPLQAEHTGEAAVYYRARIIHEYETLDIVTEQDEEGNYYEREVVTTHQETVSDNERTAPFYLDDGSGEQIRITLNGATKHTVKTLDEYQPEPPSGYDPYGIRGTTTGYHYIEEIIPLNAKLYVLGQAVEDGGELTVAKPSKDKDVEYIVSTKSEEELIKGAESSAKMSLYGAIALAVIGVILIIVGATSNG